MTGNKILIASAIAAVIMISGAASQCTLSDVNGLFFKLI